MHLRFRLRFFFLPIFKLSPIFHIQVLYLFTFFFLVAVFVSLGSLEIFEENYECAKDLFTSWIDLNSLTMARFDSAILKYTDNDEDLIKDLFIENLEDPFPEDETGPRLMKRIFTKFQSPEKYFNHLKLPQGDYLVVLLELGMLKLAGDMTRGGGKVARGVAKVERGVGRGRVEDDESRIGSVAVRGAVLEWSCGLDLTNLNVHKEEAAM